MWININSYARLACARASPIRTKTFSILLFRSWYRYLLPDSRRDARWQLARFES